MKILSASQTRDLDAYTIAHEPVSSTDLMERAAYCLFRWFHKHFEYPKRPVVIICGTGNNGGDGLVLARYLYQAHYDVRLWMVAVGTPSRDFNINLNRLPEERHLPRVTIDSRESISSIPVDAIVVDALFGSGLNRPLSGFMAELMTHLNQLKVTRIAIDLPSGLFADLPTTGISFRADYTFSFQLPKRAFFFPENNERIGDWQIGDIALSQEGIQQAATDLYYQDDQSVRGLIQSRARFSHKGTYGHALLVAGSKGKIGAALLAAKACLRVGTGLLSVLVPACGYDILQLGIPEAMVITDSEANFISSIPDTKKFEALGIGPGLDQEEKTQLALADLIQRQDRPMVLDADALNILSQNQNWLSKLPRGSILTPHPGEFKRLFGVQHHTLDYWNKQKEIAQEWELILILKGAYTSIALPDGSIWINSTGNPGMATGGSGDVLTGMITGFLACGYSPVHAARLGVFLHGLAGDLAAETTAEESLLAGDIVEYIADAFFLTRQGQ